MKRPKPILVEFEDGIVVRIDRREFERGNMALGDLAELMRRIGQPILLDGEPGWRIDTIKRTDDRWDMSFARGTV